MVSFTDLPRYLNMATGDMIYLDQFSDTIVSPNRITYQPEILTKPDLWHQVVCLHNGAFSKAEILSVILSVAGYNEIFPIGYREYAKFDSFVLTASDRKAIEILFKKNLMLTVKRGYPDMQIMIRLGAGKITAGQVHPKTQIEIVCRELLEKASLYGSGQVKMLKFDQHAEFQEIGISLLNPHHFTLVITTMLANPQAIQLVKSVGLANVGFFRLETLKHLAGFPNLIHLDLRGNQLVALSEFQNISMLRLTSIDVAKNPFTFTEDINTIHKVLLKCIPTLTRIDGNEVIMPTHVDAVAVAPAVTDDDAFLSNVVEGDSLRWDISMMPIGNFRTKYKDSKKWHKVIVSIAGFSLSQLPTRR